MNVEAIAWEYLLLSDSEHDQLTRLGQEGWELVQVARVRDESILCLKRPRPDFRERVALEQRQRYLGSLGIEITSDSGRSS